MTAEFVTSDSSFERTDFDLDIRIGARSGDAQPATFTEPTPTLSCSICLATGCANTCPPTCPATCQGDTCGTCQTRCGQDTCADTCNTCQTRCGQNTCNTCQTNCDQGTCNTCRTQCQQPTCPTSRTCPGDTCGGACTHNCTDLHNCP